MCSALSRAKPPVLPMLRGSEGHPEVRDFLFPWVIFGRCPGKGSVPRRARFENTSRQKHVRACKRLLGQSSRLPRPCSMRLDQTSKLHTCLCPLHAFSLVSEVAINFINTALLTALESWNIGNQCGWHVKGITRSTSVLYALPYIQW